MTGAGTSPGGPSASTRFIAVMLIIVGVLMVALCGGCTVVMLAAALSSGNPLSATGLAAAAVSLLMVGVIGGLPTLAGGVVAWAGWRMLHPRASSAKKVDETFE